MVATVLASSVRQINFAPRACRKIWNEDIMRTQYIFTQLKPSMTLYRRLSPADIALLSVLTLSCALLPFPRVDPSPYPSFCLGLYFQEVRLRLSCGNAAYQLANGSDSGRASCLHERRLARTLDPRRGRGRCISVRRSRTSAQRTPYERPWLYRPCYGSPPLPPGRSASCTAYRLCSPPANGPGG